MPVTEFTPGVTLRSRTFAQTGDLTPYSKNARTHSPEQIDQIVRSIKIYGFTNPIIVDQNGRILAGHGRWAAAQKLGMDEVPVIRISDLTETQMRALVLSDNRLAELATWDTDLLRQEIAMLAAEGFDLSDTGFEQDFLQGLLDKPDLPQAVAEIAGSPFEIEKTRVLSARMGEWSARKKRWLGSGIKSEIGRGDDLTYQAETGVMGEAVEAMGGTSVFDPVLTEALVRWYSEPGDMVLDPFAGGSVRGIVTAALGRGYYGVELRPEQVTANIAQAACMGSTAPVWACGDSAGIAGMYGGPAPKMILSCPPYADLEVYSDDPADISNMAYPDFLDAYRKIIAESCGLLAPGGRVAWTVGDVRAPGGSYRGFVWDTIKAFEDAGTTLTMEHILVTSVGSLPLRAGRAFEASRKLGKTHQNVLIFEKP